MTLVAVLQITLALTSCSNGASASTPSTTIPARHTIEKTTATEPKGCTNDYEIPCPVGFFYENDCCKCGEHLPEVIKCDSTKLSVLTCFYVTFNNFTHIVSVGACIFNCGIERKSELYNPIEKEAEKVDMLCTIRGRTGTLCGECLPNHYPLAYSFNMSCITCPHVRWNWGRYIMAAYLPLTLFSFFILFFKIRATNGQMTAVVTFCQSCSIPVVARLTIETPWSKVFLSLNGIWNLDFFRPFYSDLCLGIGILPTLALDYAIAVYPLLLMIISYLLIALYDRNYRVITMMWRPFRILFSLFRRNWDIRTSVIDSYASFIFLSNVKFLSVSLDLLIPTQVYQVYSNTYNHTLGLYYSADIEYFGKDHLPYGILAIVVLCVFVFLPVAILALYPFAFFQKFLNLFPVRWYILHTFVDSFQGCYKNGTELGTRDYRWFSVMYFLCRILFLAIYSATLNVLAYAFIAVLTSLLVIAIMILKPFKKDHHNLVNAAFAQLFACACICSVSVNLSMLRMHRVSNEFILVLFAVALVPYFYAIFLLACWLFKKRSSLAHAVRKIRARRRGYVELSGDHFSHRILHPEEYPKNNLSAFVFNAQ